MWWNGNYVGCDDGWIEELAMNQIWLKDKQREEVIDEQIESIVNVRDVANKLDDRCIYLVERGSLFDAILWYFYGECECWLFEANWYC